MQDLKKFSEDNPFVNVIKIDINKKNIGQKYLEILKKYIPEEKLVNRFNCPFLLLYLAISKETSQLAGYYWVIVPDKKPVWHDKYCVRPGEAFGFDAFVVPEYRGKGIFPFLKAEAVKDCTLDRKCKGLYSVVERSNKSSIKANLKLGSIVGKNYLVKIFRRNVMSIYIGERNCRVYYVFRNFKGRSF
jgi:GNAT superfamily N-acetyltransferase